MSIIPWFLGLAALIGVWWQQAKARDAVRLAGQRITRAKSLVFLDDSVVLSTLRIRRLRGKVALLREYRFEFTDQGGQRMPGKIVYFGGRVTAMHFFHPEHIDTVTP